MKNELGRKITSLTIMTIMVAGGLTFAVPSMMPGAEADHNSYLWVSAENAEFANTFGGAQVVEVVIKNPDIADTMQGASGMPHVEINGDRFAMIQGSDGAWYGYTANSATVTTADALGDAYGLEYGTTCTPAEANTITEHDDANVFDDVIAVWASQADCALAGTAIAVDDADGNNSEAVYILGGAQGVNKAPDAGGAVTGDYGNVGLDRTSTAWPFIQVYDFSAGPVEIVYAFAGGEETVLLDYDDTDSFNSHSTDRTVYPPGAHVEIEIRDMMLNLDPTRVDIWTFDYGEHIDASTGTTTEYANYRDCGTGACTDDGNTAITMTDIGFSDGGVLKVTMGGSSETVLNVYDNADSIIVQDDGDTENQLTFYETAPNTGVFTNIDDADVANLQVSHTAVRGTMANINYNDTGLSIVVGYETASIDLDESAVGEEWNSGEELPIIFTDQDRNLNNTADEDILLTEEDHYIPTIHVGSPLILTGESDGYVDIQLASGGTDQAGLDASSGIGYIGACGNQDTACTITQAYAEGDQGGFLDAGSTFTSGLVIDTGIAVTDFKAMAEGFDTDSDNILSDEASNASSSAD